MSGFSTIADMQAWQAGRALAREVYGATRTGPAARDRSFSDQIRRAAVSVMSNIAEGFGRKTAVDFLRFLDIARGSAQEVNSLLFLGSDLGYFDEAQAAAIRFHLDAVLGRMSGLQRYLRTTTSAMRRPAGSAERRTPNAERRTEPP
jgi:four helix bundle protein